MTVFVRNQKYFDGNKIKMLLYKFLSVDFHSATSLCDMASYNNGQPIITNIINEDILITFKG